MLQEVLQEQFLYESFFKYNSEVAQNGRRGALMLSMDIAHPDVEDFITIKQDLQKVTGANISIRFLMSL